MPYDRIHEFNVYICISCVYIYIYIYIYIELYICILKGYVL